MENYHCRLHVVRIYALFTCSDFLDRFVIHHALFVVHRGFAVKPSHKKFSPFSILQSPRMGPPPFKESVPRPHSLFSKNGKKEV